MPAAKDTTMRYSPASGLQAIRRQAIWLLLYSGPSLRLPVAIATTFLTHRVVVHCGINERNATIGTLTMALSPLFFRFP
jgi:hypothetical protein